MATFQTSYMYELDENGNSLTGKVDSLVPNSAASAVEEFDNKIIQVGEQFEVTFFDPGTNATYGGTYTYIGHATPYTGCIGEANGQYYLFSDDVVPVGTTLNGFVAEPVFIPDSGPPICFAEGTLILTPRGEVPVETLRAGDLVVTPLASRSIQPLRWVGRRRIECATVRDRAAVAPVLLRTGALGAGMPVRDMRVSPEHAFLLDGRLVPARFLVDGVDILQETWCTGVTYWHLELEAHGVLIADGAFAESYFDDGNRHFFNDPRLVALRPRVDRQPGGCYATQAFAPPVLDAADPALATILRQRRFVA